MGRLSAADKVVHDKNVAAVRAVLEFNDAHNVKYSRGQLYKYFNISQQMVSYLKLSSTSSPRTVKKIAGESEVPNLKQEKLDNESTTQITSTPPASPQSQRKNPVRKNGEGTKRLKLALESLAEPLDSPFSTPAPVFPQHPASPSSPQQLPTPPSTKKSKGKKRLHSQIEQHIDPISQFIKLEPASFDDEDITSEPYARAHVAPSQLQRRLQSQANSILIR